MDFQTQINELKAELKKLYNTTTMPREVEESMRDRLKPAKVESNNTDPATETLTVNEGGVATYGVAKPMDGFIIVVVNGISRKVPYYD